MQQTPKENTSVKLKISVAVCLCLALVPLELAHAQNSSKQGRILVNLQLVGTTSLGRQAPAPRPKLEWKSGAGRSLTAVLTNRLPARSVRLAFRRPTCPDRRGVPYWGPVRDSLALTA